MKQMYSYSAYDLSICSAIKLPELPMSDVSPNECDVQFTLGEVDSVPDSNEEFSGRRIEAMPDICRLTYESIGSFRVESGERVIADPVSDDIVEQETFRRLFENSLLGLILFQRGHLVLHASAVSVDGQGVVFLGPRGAGKSTTAATFEKMGYRLLEDDAVGITFPDGTPTIVPGVPQIRLRPDAAKALSVTDESTPSVESWYDKRFYGVAESVDPVPLCRCYLLRESPEPTIEPIHGPEKLMELISSTYARGLLDDAEQFPEHFGQCERVVNAVPFRTLKRPKNHQVLPSIVKMVVEDLQVAPT
jgi:hypothetical protein